MSTLPRGANSIPRRRALRLAGLCAGAAWVLAGGAQGADVKPPAAPEAPAATVAPATRGDAVEIVTGEIPPYSFLKDGRPTGLVVELVQAMAPHAGHSGVINFYAWNRAVTVVRDRPEPRLIIPLNRSPEREAQFQWVARLFVDETVLVSRRGVQMRVQSLDVAKKLQVGALLGSPLEAQLRDLRFEHVDAAADERINARKLKLGRLDAWLVAALVAPWVYREAGYDPAELDFGLRLRLNDLHLGASRSVPPETVARWTKALATIRGNGTYDAVLARWQAKNASLDGETPSPPAVSTGTGGGQPATSTGTGK